MGSNPLKTEFTEGDLFGDYRVVRRLGKGGMSSVWLLKSESTGRLFAGKILNHDKASTHSSRKRFAREAKLAMGECHENVVKVFDAGLDPGTGFCYLIMEYMHGGSLADRLKREGPLPIACAVKIARDVAMALSWAQRHGIVHRDIKPANILFGNGGIAKLADFGVAGKSQADETSLATKSNEVLGTPSYMAPEQMTNSHSADIRSDIYSLGIVLWEMLVGANPHKDASTMQILAKSIAGEKIPDVRTVRSDVPAKLAELLSSMTFPDPGRRLSSPDRIAAFCTDYLKRAPNAQTSAASPSGTQLSAHGTGAAAFRSKAHDVAGQCIDIRRFAEYVVAAAVTAAVFFASERIDVEAISIQVPDALRRWKQEERSAKPADQRREDVKHDKAAPPKPAAHPKTSKPAPKPPGQKHPIPEQQGPRKKGTERQDTLDSESVTADSIPPPASADLSMMSKRKWRDVSGNEFEGELLGVSEDGKTAIFMRPGHDTPSGARLSRISRNDRELIGLFRDFLPSYVKTGAIWEPTK